MSGKKKKKKLNSFWQVARKKRPLVYLDTDGNNVFDVEFLPGYLFRVKVKKLSLTRGGTKDKRCEVGIDLYENELVMIVDVVLPAVSSPFSCNITFLRGRDGKVYETEKPVWVLTAGLERVQ